MVQYINRITVQGLLGAFKFCLAARMQDVLPFAGVIQSSTQSRRPGVVSNGWRPLRHFAAQKK